MLAAKSTVRVYGLPMNPGRSGRRPGKATALALDGCVGQADGQWLHRGLKRAIS